MNLIKLVTLGLLLGVGAAMADDVEKELHIKLVVADNDGEQVVDWSSDDTDFSLEDLAVGESQTLENKDGNPITVTRMKDGLRFAVNGEGVTVPDVGEHATHMAFVDADGTHENVEVKVLHMPGDAVNIEVLGDEAEMLPAHHGDGITIISDEPLDDSVRESIRSVLISAGRDEDVMFIDGSGQSDHVKVISKRVEVSQ